MLTALQDPYLPNPLTDTSEYWAPLEDTPKSGTIPDHTPTPLLSGELGTINSGYVMFLHPDAQPDWIANAKPPEPTDARDAEIAALDKQLSIKEDTICRYEHEAQCLLKEIDSLRDKLSAALKANVQAQNQSAAHVLGQMKQSRLAEQYRDPQFVGGNKLGKSNSQRENDAIYRLCCQYPEINTVDFSHHSGENAVSVVVQTDDGKRHYHEENRLPGRDTIGACEEGMGKFLLSQGYGALKVGHLDRAIAKVQGMSATPCPPGQPPKHDIQMMNRLITGSDKSFKHDEFSECHAGGSRTRTGTYLDRKS